MSRRIFLLVALLTLLTACGRSTPTNYYLLESSLGPVQADGLPAKSLRVAQVSVPGISGPQRHCQPRGRPDPADRGPVPRLGRTRQQRRAPRHPGSADPGRCWPGASMCCPPATKAAAISPFCWTCSAWTAILTTRPCWRRAGRFGTGTTPSSPRHLRLRGDGAGQNLRPAGGRGKPSVRRMADYLAEKLPPLMRGKKS